VRPGYLAVFAARIQALPLRSAAALPIRGNDIKWMATTYPVARISRRRGPVLDF